MDEQNVSKEVVAAAAVLSPGVTAQLITGKDTMVLHLAVDRRDTKPQAVLLSGEETQVLVNMLLQFSAARARNEVAQEAPSQESEG